MYAEFAFTEEQFLEFFMRKEVVCVVEKGVMLWCENSKHARVIQDAWSKFKVMKTPRGQFVIAPGEWSRAPKKAKSNVDRGDIEAVRKRLVF